MIACPRDDQQRQAEEEQQNNERPHHVIAEVRFSNGKRDVDLQNGKFYKKDWVLLTQRKEGAKEMKKKKKTPPQDDQEPQEPKTKKKKCRNQRGFWPARVILIN